MRKPHEVMLRYANGDRVSTVLVGSEVGETPFMLPLYLVRTLDGTTRTFILTTPASYALPAYVEIDARPATPHVSAGFDA